MLSYTTGSKPPYIINKIKTVFNRLSAKIILKTQIFIFTISGKNLDRIPIKKTLQETFFPENSTSHLSISWDLTKSQWDLI